MFSQEAREQILTGIQEGVNKAISDHREAYAHPADISSPHLAVEIAQGIAGNLEDASDGEWDKKRQERIKGGMRATAAHCIASYRRVYPEHVSISSPHLPEDIATNCMGVLDDARFAKDKAEREAAEAARKEVDAIRQAAKAERERAAKKSATKKPPSRK